MSKHQNVSSCLNSKHYYSGLSCLDHAGHILRKVLVLFDTECSHDGINEAVLLFTQ